MLDLPRSSYYYHAQEKEEQEVKAAIEDVALEWPTYGYRRVAQQLRREKGWVINEKRVRRLMGEMGLQARLKRKKRRTTDSEHGFPRYPNLVGDLEIVRPDQVWVADITYIRLQQEFVYLAIIMDVFTRSIRGWQLERHLGQELTLTALRCALLDHLPEVHHSDQGIQYAAAAYVDLLHDHGVVISMTDTGQAWQNGYAERVIRTIKEEEVELSDYQNYHEAHDQIGRFLDEVYMYKRIHSSLGYLTPAEFESQWLAQRNVKELCS
jgi:transposase InsO family protein